MDNMIQEIESAIIAHLKKHWSGGVVEFDIGKGFNEVLKTPAISVVTEKIEVSEFKMLARSIYKVHPVVSVYSVFKAAQPQDRRGGVYPMAMAVSALLLGRNLGLDIEPLSSAAAVTEIFLPVLKDGGMVAFRAEFRTMIRVPDYATAGRWLSAARPLPPKGSPRV